MPAPTAPKERSELAQLKKTLDDGTSEWTWVLVILTDYAFVIPFFLVMLLAAELAYHFG